MSVTITEKQNLLQQIRAAGVIGAGGAGFPTYMKLDATVEHVIANGAECEPLLQKDRESMLQRRDKFLHGLQILRDLTDATTVTVAVKKKNEDVIEGYQQDLKANNFESLVYPDVYPAGDEYIQRLRWLGENAPELLVAHSYTRYLGDLSGGQVVAKIVRRALGLRGGEGLGFFHFDEIDNAKAFKDEYRRRLDELPLGDHVGERIIEEAKHVFELNQRMFEELEGSWVRALAKLLPFGLFVQQSRA